MPHSGVTMDTRLFAVVRVSHSAIETEQTNLVYPPRPLACDIPRTRCFDRRNDLS